MFVEGTRPGETPTELASCCGASDPPFGVLGTGEVVAGKGDEEDVIRDMFGLLQLVDSMLSAARLGEDEVKPYSPLILFSLLSEGLLGLFAELEFAEEESESISSSIFDFEFSRLREFGLIVLLPSEDEVSKLGNGLVLA